MSLGKTSTSKSMYCTKLGSLKGDDDCLEVMAMTNIFYLELAKFGLTW